MSKLIVDGTVFIKQFWPSGNSDADTVQLTIEKSPNKENFKFVTGKKEAFYKDFYDTPGTNDKPYIKYEGQVRQYISVRVDGIDATELHYKFFDTTTLDPKILNSKFVELNKPNYRQSFSKKATYFLTKLLEKYADPKTNSVKARYEFDCKKPTDAIDKYGRFVGKVLIQNEKGEYKINIAEELLKQGLVFPTFYCGHTKSFMNRTMKLWEDSKKDVLICHINTSFRKDMLKFDYALQEYDNTVFGCNDNNYVNLPKFYRRWTLYNILKDSGNMTLSWKDYLKMTPNDNVVYMEDIDEYNKLKDKSQFTKFHHISELFDDKNNFIREITNIVFI